jgi:hypothetical protein
MVDLSSYNTQKVRHVSVLYSKPLTEHPQTASSNPLAVISTLPSLNCCRRSLFKLRLTIRFIQNICLNL